MTKLTFNERRVKLLATKMARSELNREPTDFDVGRHWLAAVQAVGAIDMMSEAELAALIVPDVTRYQKIKIDELKMAIFRAQGGTG